MVGLGDKTPLASPDHWQAMQIIDAGVFYSRLTKWDQYFDGLPVHAISAQLYYSLAYGALLVQPGPGQFVVDISDTLDTKLAAVRCYETQFPPEKQALFERLKSVNMALGMGAGFAAGEMLQSPRSLGTRDLMQMVFHKNVVPEPMKE